jgi:dTMP kinase
LFFSFDGVDGVGKTTQLKAFCQWLRENGQVVVECRDPGGTPLGESIRKIVLHGDDVAICARSEMLLYMASRAQLVRDVIQPALDAGKSVVSDRFLLANVVYQGHAGGVPPEMVWQVGKIATGGLEPDQTFLLDMPADRAAARIDRELDRMEAKGLDYLGQVRQSFLDEAMRRPDRIMIINADAPPDCVQESIRTKYLELTT